MTAPRDHNHNLVRTGTSRPLRHDGTDNDVFGGGHSARSAAQRTSGEREQDARRPSLDGGSSLPPFWSDPTFWQGVARTLRRLAMIGLAALTLLVTVGLIMGPPRGGGTETPALPVVSPTPPAVRQDDVAASAEVQAPTSSLARFSPLKTLDFSGLAYEPADNAQCDGEQWKIWAGSDGPRIAWFPEPKGLAEDYYLTFKYDYDGRRLHLFAGEKISQTNPSTAEPVRERTVTLVHKADGSWLMNGKRMLECAG
jgi:hypothetical protein